MASTSTGPPGGPCGNKVKPPSPRHRFVIVLHSPDRVPESGLRVCRPEKKAAKARRVSPADSFLQSGLVATIGNCGDFALFFQDYRQFSLPCRLCGGGRSQVLTFLRLNSLLTGKITGNFVICGTVL
jgi:hypothetical protein